MKTKTHIRYKTKSGIPAVGVTTVIGLLNKPALLYWAWDCGCKGIDYRKFADEKAAQGTLAHEMILCHLQNMEPDTKDYTKNQIDAAENAFLSYLEWERGREIEPILLETPLVHEKLAYGGTFDFYGKVDGVFTVMDFKTGKAIYPEMAVQLAAYDRLIRDTQGVIPLSWKILRIGRDETEGFEVKEYSREYLNNCWAIFEHLLSVYRLQKEMKNE
jgi:hypothetical protein